PMVGLNRYEVEDLLEIVASRLEAMHGYAQSSRIVPATLMPPVGNTEGARLLVRSSGDTEHLLRIGYKTFRSQPIHVVMYGVTTDEDGSPTPNADVAQMETLLEEARVLADQQNETLSAADLATQTINLSYIES